MCPAFLVQLVNPRSFKILVASSTEIGESASLVNSQAVITRILRLLAVTIFTVSYS